jgi:hypothetical protein
MAAATSAAFPKISARQTLPRGGDSIEGLLEPLTERPD